MTLASMNRYALSVGSELVKFTKRFNHTLKINFPKLIKKKLFTLHPIHISTTQK